MKLKTNTLKKLLESYFAATDQEMHEMFGWHMTPEERKDMLDSIQLMELEEFQQREDDRKTNEDLRQLTFMIKHQTNRIKECVNNLEWRDDSFTKKDFIKGRARMIELLCDSNDHYPDLVTRNASIQHVGGKTYHWFGDHYNHGEGEDLHKIIADLQKQGYNSFTFKHFIQEGA